MVATTQQMISDYSMESFFNIEERENGNCEVIGILISLIMANISHISKHQDIYLKT
jgi:hypothetical protein